MRQLSVTARRLSITVVSLLLAAGCALSPTASKKQEPATGFYVVIAHSTPFYRYGPAQGFGPDSMLVAGQPLKMLHREWGFSQVQTDNGQTGYVSTDDIGPAPAPPKPVATPKSKLLRSEPIPPDYYPSSEMPPLPSGAPSPTFRY